MMCGIVGGFGDISESILEKMILKVAHRGPDYQAGISLENVHLGHTRLSIIDLSPASNQPIWDVHKTVCIVFNGEIYNYQSIRKELLEAGYTFASKGDAEVILNFYLFQGVESFQKLQGIFAFSIWDTRSNKLIVVRDPYGVKPLYYTENEDGFYFASELKSLLSLKGVSRELNYDALFRTVAFLWSPGPDTVFKHISKLDAGHFLVVEDKKIVHLEQYAQYAAYQPERISINHACQAVNGALLSSIEAQLVSDVPVGAFLSGGVDSSLIVALANTVRETKLACFTIKLSTNDRNSDGMNEDLPYAQRVAKHLDLDLTIVDVSPNIAQLLPNMLYHLDEPQADPAPLNVWLICEEARKQGIKVLFSGAGGDDIFTGYRRHRAVKLEKYWTILPIWTRKILRRTTSSLPKKNAVLRRLSKMFAYATLPDDERLLSYFYWIDPKIIRGLFTKQVQSQLSLSPMAPILDALRAYPTDDPLEKMLYLERRYFLTDHNFNYTDKMSMAHGVEVRVPFLDKQVVDIASRLKSNIKMRYGQGKWILKKISEKYLPKSIIYRSKVGFGAPLRHWLKYDLQHLLDDLLSEASIVKRGIFDYKAVAHLIEADRAGKEDYSYPIFALLCIEQWCRIFIDGEVPEEGIA